MSRCFLRAGLSGRARGEARRCCFVFDRSPEKLKTQLLALSRLACDFPRKISILPYCLITRGESKSEESSINSADRMKDLSQSWMILARRSHERLARDERKPDCPH